MSDKSTELPADLPVPVDDGAADHLEGSRLPAVSLPSTSGAAVDLDALGGDWVIYVYPMTGRPGVSPPAGWDAIPGARGCTPQSCAFRDHHGELEQLGAGVLGLSVQASAEQLEARKRLQLPYHLVSDEGLRLREALRLPTFTAEGRTFYRRLTLVARDGIIRKVFYPVFPPDRNAEDVVAWLRASG